MPPLILELLDLGIQPQVWKKNGTIYWDLNLNAKNFMYLYEKDGKYFVDTRYGETHEVESVYDLIRLARHGMHGRDYVDMKWSALIENIHMYE
jgi:hypothetical protein